MVKKLLLAAAALLVSAGAQAQTTMQFPTNPWGGFAPEIIECGKLVGANMNSTADQAIIISVPSGIWMVSQIIVSDPSISLTAAVGGFYSAASKSGVTLVANSQAYSGLTTKALNTTGNVLLATLAAAANTTAFGGYAQGANKISQIYFSLTTPQSATATANIRVTCRAMY